MDIEIILTGSFGVGKSSIYNRFVYNDFSSRYYGTLGVRVNEKQIMVDNICMNVKLWDVAGEVSQEKVPKAYFRSPSVILYVVDLNRTFAFKNVTSDIAYLKEITKDKTIIIVGNKVDLVDETTISSLLKNKLDFKFHYFTSAKTGENIDTLFQFIAAQQLEKFSAEQ